MDYESPLGGVDASSYVDVDPSTGTEGSRVRAPAIENHLRELVYLIEQAGLVPDRGDLTQVYQAIAALISGSVRPLLTADLDLYIATTGSDANDGLTVGTPFATFSKAFTEIIKYDLGHKNVAINAADGTYAQQIIANEVFHGRGTVSIVGNSGSPQNVVIVPASGNAISCVRTRLAVTDVEIRAPGAGSVGVFCQVGELSLSNVRFGACAVAHIQADTLGVINAGNYAIVGASGSHLRAAAMGLIGLQSGVITVSGTPAFSAAFATALDLGLIEANPGSSFSGAATGQTYNARTNAVINTNAGGPNFFPGNVSGAVFTGGQYT